MPELPEVENVGRALETNLTGRRLTGLKVDFAGVLGQSVRKTRAALVGKVLDRGPPARQVPDPAVRVGDDGTAAYLMIHLRMTGQFFILDGFVPDKHVHLTFDFDGLPVHYRDIRKFGRLALVEDGVAPAALAHVGPDMMKVRFAEWHRRIGGAEGAHQGPAAEPGDRGRAGQHLRGRVVVPGAVFTPRRGPATWTRRPCARC